MTTKKMIDLYIEYEMDDELDDTFRNMVFYGLLADDTYRAFAEHTRFWKWGDDNTDCIVNREDNGRETVVAVRNPVSGCLERVVKSR